MSKALQRNPDKAYATRVQNLGNIRERKGTELRLRLHQGTNTSTKYAMAHFGCSTSTEPTFPRKDRFTPYQTT